jgi:hypothetical protein
VGLSLLTSCERNKSNLPSTAFEPLPGASEPPLAEMVRKTLEYNLKDRLLSTERNAAWQVAHGAVAYGRDLPLGVDGKRVNALDYLFAGGDMQGWELSMAPVLQSTGRPGIRARVEAGSYIGQGHVDQFLGYFSQIPLSLDTPISVGDQRMTVADWGRQSQFDVSDNPYREYSWTLIALTNLFPEDYEWKAKDGKTWTLEPLVAFEAKQDLTTSPCGGMHRLMGLAHAVKYWQRRSQRFDSGWLLAQNKVRESIELIRAYQNTDGSFSTNYTSRPGTSSDLSLRIGATGHTLEFLAFALDDKQIREDWMERAVRRMCRMVDAASQVDLECGGLYHGLAGLALYEKRVLRQPK